MPKRNRTKTVRTNEVIELIENSVEDKGGKVTVCWLTREFNMDKMTMDHLVKEDLGLKTFKRTPRQALKPCDQEKRLVRSKKILSKLKHKAADTVILFSDETPFSLGEMVANDTSFYLAKACGDGDDSIVHTSKERHFANLQILAVIASDGQKCNLIFLKEKERPTA